MKGPHRDKQTFALEGGYESLAEGLASEQLGQNLP